MTSFSARRKAMVDTQIRPSDVTKYPIISAMLSQTLDSLSTLSKIKSNHNPSHN